MFPEFTFLDIPNIASWTDFTPRELTFPEKLTNRQRQWEFYVTKLHGADLIASDEDMQVLKDLVNKLGR